MKKITLCSILCLVTFLCNSQVVIFEQSPNNIGFSLASNFSENDEVGIYGADDFELTSDTALGQITFYGTIGNGTDPSVLTGFNIYIYENEGGSPSGDPTILDSGVVELVNISPDNYTMDVNGADISFAINITDANGGNQIVLPAGTYWIVGAANLEEELSSPNRWSWMNSLDLFGENPLLIDPDDFFGLGATDWTTINSIPDVDLPAFAFSITDEVLSVDENNLNSLTIFPNPTNGIINIENNNSIVKDVKVYNILGQQIEIFFDGNMVDISQVSRGTYILEFRDELGAFSTMKVIKI